VGSTYSPCSLATVRYISSQPHRLVQLRRSLASERMDSVFEIPRIVLYFAEWVMNVVVWGGTADKLTRGGLCYFGREATCGAVIFFGVVSWIILTACVVLHIVSVQFGAFFRTIFRE
jgi:hypothetical protein